MSNLRKTMSKFKYDYEYKKLTKKYSGNKIPMFRIVEIETINRCNGKCAFCPVNVTEPQRKYAKMSDELFYKIIDELSAINYDGMISLYSNNEPLLDERIISFANYAREKVQSAFINLATNGSLLTIEKVNELYAPLDACTIDNYSDNNEINSNLVDVIDYINKNNYTDVFNIVMRKQHEVLTTRGGLAPNRKGELIKTINHGCFYPFIQLVVRPDGKCSLCCNDALGKMTLGDVNKNSLEEIWYSKEYSDIRSEMIKHKRNNISLCKYCDSMFNAYAFEKTRRKYN